MFIDLFTECILNKLPLKKKDIDLQRNRDYLVMRVLRWVCFRFENEFKFRTPVDI